MEITVGQEYSWTVPEVLLSHETQELTSISVVIEPALAAYLSFDQELRTFTYGGSTDLALLHELAPMVVFITLTDQ